MIKKILLLLLLTFSFIKVEAQLTWTSSAAAANNVWYGLTYGNGLFVAVAGSGTGNRVMTSPDGINWTSRTSAANNSWNSVTYGNGLFVAVAYSGTGNRVMTSPDGITWTSRTSAADNSWVGITYGNGLFVAVANSGTGNRVMTSPDGINWTLRTSAADNGWLSITYGNGLFVATSSTGTGNRVMTSPDGINWTIRSTPYDGYYYGVGYGNGVFVAVSRTGGKVIRSTDGINWTSVDVTNNPWRSIVFGNGLFLTLSGTGTNRIMTSPDGITWTEYAAPNTSTWYTAGYGGNVFVGLATSGSGDLAMSAIYGVPNVITTTTSSISSISSISGGNVLSEGLASVTVRGVCWSTSANPTIADSKTTDGSGIGVFTGSLTGLTASTTYHYRAYATNSYGISYGSDLTFTTLATSFSASVTSQTNVACNGGNTGSATVSVTGGTAPYTYSWSPSGGSSATASGLAAGAYIVTVTDATSATTTANVTITQPSPITTSLASLTTVACNGGSNGSATITTPTGGTGPYSYSWSPSGGTGLTATGLTAGAYVVTVTDANTCTKTQNVTVTQPSAITTSLASLTTVACNGGSNGSATISTPTGGTGPYSYSWSPSGGTGLTATGLTAGAYVVTVTDANTCTKTQNVTITQPSALIAGTSQNNVTTIGGSDGSATVTPSGGTPSYSYSWSPSGGTGATASELSAGTFICTITDANSCTLTKTFTIIHPTNHAPTASNSSVNSGQNADYVFTASNFSYVDSDSDVLNRIQITTLPVLGTLYNDDNLNGVVDVSETLLLNGTVTKIIIDAGKLKFKPVTNALGAVYTTFGYKVHDGSVYSSSSYTMSINVLYPTSTVTGSWSTSGTWNISSVPSSTQNAEIATGHTVTISGNTTINDLKLDNGANITVTGTAILTINGDLYDALGTFTIAPGAKVLLKGNIRNNQGTVKVVNTSTNGMQLKGNVHVPQGSDG